MAFADLFNFSRSRVGTYRNAQGTVLLADIDQPRFDHTAGGVPRGLKIEGPTGFGRGDRLGAKEAAWPTEPGTVLHEYQPPGGQVRRRAFYAQNPRLVIDGVLHAQGWHRRIGVIPGFLKNRGGYVTYLDDRYDLGGVIAVAPYQLLDATGGDAPTPLIEG